MQTNWTIFWSCVQLRQPTKLDIVQPHTIIVWFGVLMQKIWTNFNKLSKKCAKFEEENVPWTKFWILIGNEELFLELCLAKKT